MGLLNTLKNKLSPRRTGTKTKVPEGIWVQVGYSPNIEARCGRIPKVIYLMKGENAIQKELYSKAKLDEYRGKYPIAKTANPPCTEEINDFTAFGSIQWDEKKVFDKL